MGPSWHVFWAGTGPLFSPAPGSVIQNGNTGSRDDALRDGAEFSMSLIPYGDTHHHDHRGGDEAIYQDPS
jgi:hypothetical protein